MSTVNCEDLQFNEADNYITTFSTPFFDFNFTIPGYSITIPSIPYPCGWDCCGRVWDKCICWEPDWCYFDLVIPIYPDIIVDIEDFSVIEFDINANRFYQTSTWEEALVTITFKKYKGMIYFRALGATFFTYNCEDLGETTVSLQNPDSRIFIGGFDFSFSWYGIGINFYSKLFLKTCIGPEGLELFIELETVIGFVWDGDDYNATWLESIQVFQVYVWQKILDIEQEYVDIAQSYDGKKFLASAANGTLYFSEEFIDASGNLIDAGESWLNYGIKNFIEVKSNHNGSVLYAITGIEGDFIYTSSDGLTWNSTQFVDRDNGLTWKSIDCDYTGNRIIAGGISRGIHYIYTSIDGGRTVSKTEVVDNIYCVGTCKFNNSDTNDNFIFFICNNGENFGNNIYFGRFNELRFTTFTSDYEIIYGTSTGNSETFYLYFVVNRDDFPYSITWDGMTNPITSLRLELMISFKYTYITVAPNNQNYIGCITDTGNEYSIVTSTRGNGFRYTNDDFPYRKISFSDDAKIMMSILTESAGGGADVVWYVKDFFIL